jgi:hypothetical protein
MLVHMVELLYQWYMLVHAGWRWYNLVHIGTSCHKNCTKMYHLVHFPKILSYGTTMVYQWYRNRTKGVHVVIDGTRLVQKVYHILLPSTKYYIYGTISIPLVYHWGYHVPYGIKTEKFWYILYHSTMVHGWYLVFGFWRLVFGIGVLGFQSLLIITDT